MQIVVIFTDSARLPQYNKTRAGTDFGAGFLRTMPEKYCGDISI